SLDRHRQAIKGKAVLAVSMNWILHLLGQIGDGDGSKGAFAYAYSTANTEVLSNEGLAVHKHDGLVARADRRAEVFAFFRAFSRLASVAIDDSYPHVLPQFSSIVHVTSQR